MTSMLHDRVYPMQNGSFKLSRIDWFTKAFACTKRH